MLENRTNQKLSLLIPVYNEEGNLDRLFDRLTRVEWQTAVELVFVDDGSKDRSFEEVKINAEEFLKKKFLFELSVITHRFEKNQGKGAAIHKAVQLATGNVCVVQDADFEYDPNDLLPLVQVVFMGEADVVFGSRFKKSSFQVHRTFHYFINRFLTLLSNLCSGLYLTDMETCYKVVRSEIIKNINLTSPRFGFEPEITAHLARLKVRVFEMPIRYFPRNYLEGKKITWKDGVAAVRHILYFNLLFNNKKRFHKEMPKNYLLSGTQWL